MHFSNYGSVRKLLTLFYKLAFWLTEQKLGFKVIQVKQKTALCPEVLIMVGSFLVSLGATGSFAALPAKLPHSPTQSRPQTERVENNLWLPVICHLYQ